MTDLHETGVEAVPMMPGVLEAAKIGLRSKTCYMKTNADYAG